MSRERWDLGLLVIMMAGVDGPGGGCERNDECHSEMRRTVSGRELPRTNVARWNRIDQTEAPPGGEVRPVRPHQQTGGSC
jgi:hypothetical protein